MNRSMGPHCRDLVACTAAAVWMSPCVCSLAWANATRGVTTRLTVADLYFFRRAPNFQSNAKLARPPSIVDLRVG